MSTKKFVTKGDVLFYFKMYSDAVKERTNLPLWHFEPNEEYKYRKIDPSYMFCVVTEMHFLSVPANQVTDRFHFFQDFIEKCDEEMHQEIQDTPLVHVDDVPSAVAEMVNVLVAVWNKRHGREALVA